MKLAISTSILIALIGLSSSACPDALKVFKSDYTQGISLCELHDRYQLALQKLREKNINEPERIGNIMAPRFINLPDWESKRTVDPKSALEIYKPSPQTWMSWESGAKILDKSAQKNFTEKRISELSLGWLFELHGTTLDKLLSSAGIVRTQMELGLAISQKTSLTRQQIIGVRSNEYFAIHNQTRLVQFVPTQCLEDRDDQFRQAWSAKDATKRVFYYDEWSAINEETFFKDEQGSERQCGYIVYTPVEEIEGQMNAWLAEVNASIKNWNSRNLDNDPIFVAARAQRWFVTIHPYQRGNGRLSRFVMDWLLQSIGLPAPLLKDMNEDLYVSEKDWAAEVGKGIIRTVTEAESCVKNLEKIGCQVISSEGEKQ